MKTTRTAAKRYTVSNTYDIAGETHHRTAAAALRARDKREGTGWIVTDDAGNRYDWQQGCPDTIYVSYFAQQA